MIFAGLPFLQTLLLFGAAGAAVVALYILKLRRRTVAVPFSKLWDRILKDKEATSLFSKLKRLISLLVQLLLLALLALAVGDPRAAATLIKGRTLVVLLDSSASMQATDVSPTRLEVAKEETRKLIRSLGGADRMLVAQMDASVTPLGPVSGDTSELERELDGVKASESRADFPKALRFATDALRGVDSGEVVVVSDGNLGEARDAAGPVHLGSTKLSYVKVGKGQQNTAITEFSVRRYPLDKNRYEVMLEVANTGADAADVELKLTGDGQLVDLTKLRLQPGERLPRFYPNLSGASRTLEATVSPVGATKDELPIDNKAYALLPERRRAKVLVVTQGNTYLEAALLLDEYLDVTLESPKAYAEHIAKGPVRADVVIFDAVTPRESPKAHAIYIDPRAEGAAPIKVAEEIKSPGFDKIDRKHPVVRFTALDDVNIARGHKLVAGPSDKVIGASDAGPILVSGVREGFKFLALGFDARESDLPLRVAWPLLLLNTINWFTGEDVKYLSSFRTGEVWRIPLDKESTDLAAILKGPFGEPEHVAIHDGKAVVFGQHSGFYELTARAGDGTSVTNAFAANLLDIEESTILPANEITVDGKTAGRVDGFHVGVRREIWIYLVLLAVLLTAIEWATYHRRLTV